MSADDACNRYRARLDIFLAGLETDERRRAFLDREFDRWERLYDRWLGEPDILPNATAFDFSITLADLATRQIRYGRVVELVPE